MVVLDRRLAARLRASLSRLRVPITFLDREVFESATLLLLVPVFVLDGLLEPDILVLIVGLLVAVEDEEVVTVDWALPLSLLVGVVVVEDPLTAKPGANGLTHPSKDAVAFGLGTMDTLDVPLTVSVGPDVLFPPRVDGWFSPFPLPPAASLPGE